MAAIDTTPARSHNRARTTPLAIPPLDLKLTPASALESLGIPAAGPPAVRITGKMLSYDQLVDIFLMSPPGETQRALARRVGYSEAWLSRIIASDSFQTRLADRIEKDIEPERREAFRLRFASIEEEAKGLLHASLQKLAARLEDPAGVPDELLLRSAAVTSKLLGYGARNEPAAPRVDLHLHLEQLATNLRNLNRAPVATVPAGGDRMPDGADVGRIPGGEGG